MSLLNRRVQLLWKGQTVLAGACTSVVAYDVVSQHMSQFAGPAWREWWSHNLHPSLNVLPRVISGERIVFEYQDDTGHAQALIEAL